MAVKIGSARIDENGKARGGKAGDQTGKEVSTQSWYKHKKGWRVFRPKLPEAAALIADDMQAACNNPLIGYDQGQRGTLYDVAKKVGFNCAYVKTKCETDCSALVRVCCAYAGIMLPNFRTTDEAAVLLASGQFVELTGSKYTDSSDYLCRGDILVTRTQGHTVIVLSNGKFAPERLEPVTMDNVQVTGHTVNVRIGPGTAYATMGIAKKGEVLPYKGETENGWYKVDWLGRLGWISGKYAILTN